MEKIVVKNFEELRGLGNLIIDVDDHNYSIEFNDVISYFKKCDLEKAVKVLNVLGGNFEYKPVEVIDTLEKWEEFQDEIMEQYIYDRKHKRFRGYPALTTWDFTRSIEEIEHKYNVDLKILKEG